MEVSFYLTTFYYFSQLPILEFLIENMYYASMYPVVSVVTGSALLETGLALKPVGQILINQAHITCS